MNLTARLRELATQSPELPAFITIDDTLITFGTLDSLIDAAARRLLRLGVQPGQIAALGFSGVDEALVLVISLALARIGAASADPQLPSQHLTLALLPHGVAARADMRCEFFGMEWLDPDSEAEAAVAIHPAPDTLRIFATSGTSGVSRFVPISHTSMRARLAPAWAPSYAPGQERMICALGLGGSWSHRLVLKLLLSGGALVFSNPRDIINTILRHRVTSLVTSPFSLQSILDRLPAGIGPLAGLRSLELGGSQVPPSLIQRARINLCSNVLTSYGASEIGPCAGAASEVLATMDLAVGVLAEGLEVEALDPSGAVLPPGEIGELRFRTPGMASGYLDNPSATAAHFRDGWFYSGDLGHLGVGRMLCISGRLGEFINAGGVKISPRVIEDVLLSHPDILEAAAFPVPDRDGLAQIWAAIVSESPVDHASLARFCAEHLGEQSPKFILQMKALPRNANGKVLTRDLISYAERQIA